MPYKVTHGEATQIKYSSDEVFARIKHENIRFIDLQFSSLLGRFHHTTISADTFTPEQMQDGLPKLDGSSIVGFTSVDDSDLVLKPDPNTFAIIPWITEKRRQDYFVIFTGAAEEEDLNVIQEELHKRQKSI